MCTQDPSSDSKSTNGRLLKWSYLSGLDAEKTWSWLFFRVCANSLSIVFWHLYRYFFDLFYVFYSKGQKGKREKKRSFFKLSVKHKHLGQASSLYVCVFFPKLMSVGFYPFISGHSDRLFFSNLYFFSFIYLLVVSLTSPIPSLRPGAGSCWSAPPPPPSEKHLAMMG